MVEDPTVTVNWLAQPDVEDVLIAMMNSEQVRKTVRSLTDIIEEARVHSENCILRFRALRAGLSKAELQAIILYSMLKRNDIIMYPVHLVLLFRLVVQCLSYCSVAGTHAEMI